LINRPRDPLIPPPQPAAPESPHVLGAFLFHELAAQMMRHDSKAVRVPELFQNCANADADWRVGIAQAEKKLGVPAATDGRLQQLGEPMRSPFFALPSLRGSLARFRCSG
jgi:hypothetical protein